MCGLYDVSPAKFGQSFNNTRLAKDFGGRTEIYTGFDVVMNARFGKGGLITGGLNSGNTKINNCASPDFPAQFCDQSSPWANQTQVKLSAAHSLPYGLNASVVFQNLAGLARSATFVATNAQILPSLGRNLAQCGAAAVCNGTVVVSLLPPNQYREPRSSQVDLRLMKAARIHGVRVTPRFDVYNLLNTGPVTALFTRYSGTTGGAWLNAQGVLTGRLFKFGFQVDF